MLANLNSLVGFLFNTMTGIYTLYVGGGILTAVFVIWLIKKVSHLVDKIF